jgi:hypothetical protein
MDTVSGRATWAAREPPPGLFPMRTKNDVSTAAAGTRLSASRPRPAKPELPEALRNPEAQQATRKLSALHMMVPELEAVNVASDNQGEGSSDGGSYYSSSDYDDDDDYYDGEEEASSSDLSRPQAPAPSAASTTASKQPAPTSTSKAASPVASRPPNPFGGGGGLDLISAIKGFNRGDMAPVDKSGDKPHPKQQPKRQDGPLNPLEELRQKLMTRPFIE